MRRTYDPDEARSIAASLSIDFAKSGFSADQFRSGLNVEAEHGNTEPSTNVTNDDPLTTGKIALAHLNELPDYYSRLKKMEADVPPGSATDAAFVATDGGGGRSVIRKGIIALALLGVGAAALVCLRFGRGMGSRRAVDSQPPRD